MNDRYGFNPRKCNSVSTLNGCIEREMPRVIIALHTSNEVFDILKLIIKLIEKIIITTFGTISG